MRPEIYSTTMSNKSGATVHGTRLSTSSASCPIRGCMYVAPSGQVFMSGPLATTYSLDPKGPGNWIAVGNRANGAREYAPSVMYEIGKILYIGGGNNPDTQKPTAGAEIIDLTAATPAWHPTGAMHFERRQHNATILPDGTVLVTGGTQGGGGPNNGFNDLTPGAPVHAAELWDPRTNGWALLASESIDRCYHATAVLLPDATVLSAGGGEYRPDGRADNDPKDSHRDAQVFSPPYLFQADGTLAPRPVIGSAPSSIGYGGAFDAPYTPGGTLATAGIPSDRPPIYGGVVMPRVTGLQWHELANLSATMGWHDGPRKRLLVFTSAQANALVVAGNPDVEVVGGYTGLIPVPSLATLSSQLNDHQISIAIVPGAGDLRSADPRVRLVESVCTRVASEDPQSAGPQTYLC